MTTGLQKRSCCIVGGGPAGVMLGYMLARSGVRVTVLEKHRDFFRDFRGDTVHPSTLELLWELGLLEEFLQLQHQKVTSLHVRLGNSTFEIANLDHARTHCRFIAIMPQWDFLNFLSEQAKKYPTFDLRMEHEAVDLRRQGNRVRGVVARTPQGIEEIEADLVVASDGRHSAMRAAAEFEVEESGVPIDVLWFRISCREEDREPGLGNVNYGKILVLINRKDYYQAAYIIRKDSYERIKQRGLEAFRQDIAQVVPFLSDRIEELKSWEQVKLLSVQINRLKRWYRPGLLCIGDAAHAMSPVFGVGINLAIQDAVAAANVLAGPLLGGQDTDPLLRRVQQRRELRTRLTQRLQAIAHIGLKYVFEARGPLEVPWPVRLVLRSHVLLPILLRVVGIGKLPERVSETVLLNGSVVFKQRTRAITLGRVVGTGAGIAAAAVWLFFSRNRL